MLEQCFCWGPVSGSHHSTVQGSLSSAVAGVVPTHSPLALHSPAVQTSLKQAVPSATGEYATTPVSGSQTPVEHGFVVSIGTGVPAVQLPAPSQVSLPLQRSKSLQLEPAERATCVTPCVGSQLSSVHALPSFTASGVPAVHVPLWQVSLPLHTLPSGQAVPFAFVGFEQVPFVGLQVPASWHASDAVQITGFAPTHVPVWQVSDWVQPSPSEQVLPFAFAGVEQRPVDGLHVPASWHWSIAVQVTGVPFTQLPDALHVSEPLQRLPSEQLVPVATGVCVTPMPEVQASTVQGLPSSRVAPVQSLGATGVSMSVSISSTVRARA
jgi:hypothetical protein